MNRHHHIYEKYSSILAAIRGVTKADDCSIFLLDSELGMDADEKKEIFRSRIARVREHNQDGQPYSAFLAEVSDEETDKYSILTYFIGTESRWNLPDYRNRPSKYIVFHWENEELLPIAEEGLTAYVARTGRSLVLSKREGIEKHASFAGINEGSGRIHPNCHQVAICPIVQENEAGRRIMGVIRCDIYDHKPDHRFTEANSLEAIGAVNNLIARIIDNGKEAEAKHSYAVLFNGMNIIESLKGIGALMEDPTDTEIYRTTMKLFYVLKRRRYFGYDSIIDRVMEYLKDTCNILQINSRPLVDLLESFKKHEDLMLYSNEKYRDHFMHQFHVFVLGYIIMHHVGMDKISKLLRHNHDSHGVEQLGTKNLLRIWLLASIFHDSCYLLQDFDDNVSRFLTDILKVPNGQPKKEGGGRFSVDLKWAQLMNADLGFSTKLSSILEYLQVRQQDINLSKLATNLNRLMLERNHGVLSALVMMQKMAYADESKDTKHYDFEMSMAGLAIALHTERAYQTTIEAVQADDKNRKIYFENYPILFLLIYCDFIQEWGRKGREDDKNIAKPGLYSLCKDRDNITCKLIYDQGRFESGQVPPGKERLEGLSKNLRGQVCSLNFDFSVKYYHTVSDKPQVADLRKDRIFEFSLRESLTRKGLRRRCEEFKFVLKDGRSIYLNNCSQDPISGICDIGFGTDSEFQEGEPIDLECSADGSRINGTYRIVRTAKTAQGLRYQHFVGALRKPA